MKTFKKVLIIIFLLGAGIIYYVFTGNYSDGFRAGTIIIKLSKKGILLNTYEGQLNLGMVVSDDAAASGPNSNIWDFSVIKDTSLINKMNDAMESGKRVRLHYKEKFVKLPWRGDTKYLVYEIESSGGGK
jgi:hypothetical protein